MSIVCKAVASALRADATFAALVGSYLGQPAIFAEDIGPADAPLPMVLVKPVTVAPRHTLTRKGARAVIDVHAFIRGGLGTGPLDEIEERIRETLDEPAAIPFSVAGHRIDSISVTAVQPGAYEPGVESRVITLEALLQRT